jgi:deazaflavin-dependent oxidoreductase (nitroreductase family)
MTQLDRAPRVTSIINVIAKPLLAAGVPLGYNGLLTVRGRKSGEARTTPLAVIEVDGRRWVWSPWGEVNWVRNLRAAGQATLTVRQREQDVRAIELDPAQRIAFFRDTLVPFARGIRGGEWFLRTVDGVDVRDPETAAENRPVFELHAVA